MEFDIRRHRLVLATALLLYAGQAHGATLLINQVTPHVGTYGYGLANWDDMTNALNAAFGVGNVTVSASPIGDISGYDRLWITARQIGDPGLSAVEQANLLAFIASGKRVVIFGENNAWTAWNNSFLTILGGSFSGVDTGGETITTAVVHPVTDGIPSIRAGDDGIAAGGTSLFSKNVVTLWGTNQNVITVLSLGMIDDSSDGFFPNNQAFKENLAQWLAADAVEPVPEPSSCWLVAIGLAGALARYRQRP